MGVKVRERKPGEWWVFIDHKGKRKAVKVGSEDAAIESAGKIEAALTLGILNLAELEPKEYPKFSTYAEKWMKQHVKLTCKDATIKGYGDCLRLHVNPAIGNFPLNEITRETIRMFCYDKREAKFAKESVKQMVAIISGVFNFGIENGLVTSNPASRPGKLLKSHAPKEKAEFLTLEEGRTVLEKTKEHHPKFYPLFLTALRSGMRQGEILGLKWGDIDWRGKFIEVKRSAWYGKITTPKNGKTRRVDMSDQLAAVLTDHRRKTAGEWMKRGKSMPEWVFPSDQGTIYNPGYIRKIFYSTVSKAEIRHVPFHALRHSFASMLIGNGEPLAYIKEQMGHHSIQLTVDVYGHLIPSANRQAVNRLDDPEWGKPATYTQPRIAETQNASEPKGNLSVVP